MFVNVWFLALWTWRQILQQMGIAPLFVKNKCLGEGRERHDNQKRYQKRRIGGSMCKIACLCIWDRESLQRQLSRSWWIWVVYTTLTTVKYIERITQYFCNTYDYKSACSCTWKKLSTRMRWFRQKNFRFKLFACVSHAHAKKKFFASFRFEFLLPTKAKLIHRIIALFRFQTFFVSLSFASDFFVSLQSEMK